MTSDTVPSPLFILYGSATGNAEHIAKDLAATYEKSTPSYFPSVVCCELDQYKKKCQAIWETEPAGQEQVKHGVLIVASTTGNGDAPENAGRFVRYIKRKTTVAAQPFRHITYAVLGLGDTNYDQFCQTGKTIDKKLHELGGTRCRAVACADEATGLEETVEPWVESILPAIAKACRGDGDGAETVEKAPVSEQASTLSSSEQEEKKMDALDAATLSTPSSPTAETPPSPTPAPSVSSGVQTVRSLLGLNASEPVWEVNHSKLPGLAGSLSNCELVHEGEDDEEAIEQRARGMSITDSHSTASSVGYHYNLRRPYESTILKARYLTRTPTEAAQAVVASTEPPLTDQSLIRAFDIYDEHFPLAGSDDADLNAKRVLELTLSLPDDYTLEYAPGDSLGLLVENTPQAVTFVLDMLRKQHGITPDQKISIDEEHPITVEEAIRTSIDLCSPIKKKRTLYSLSQFATDPDEMCTLQLLSSKTPEGDKLFQKYVDEQRLSVFDILEEFPSLQSITTEGLLSILPSIPPRYYSVSSYPLSSKSLELNIAFSVVDYMAPSLIVNGQERGQRRVHGVATRYMEALCSFFVAGSDQNPPTDLPKLKIFPKPSSDFRMPEAMSVPLILVGPGTGIAPFMGFLGKRRALSTSCESTDAAHTVVEGTWRGGYDMEENELPVSQHDGSGLRVGIDYRTKQTFGSVDVFFGCRHKDHDWLYRTELQQLEEDGVITRLYTAFSRDGNRQYVQDIMKGDDECAARLIEKILDQGASVFVCGDGNAMGKDVQAAIVELLSQRLGVDKAKAYLETMKVNKRFLMDIWS